MRIRKHQIYLAKDGHAFEETEEDTDPGKGQSDQQLPAQSSEVLNTICQLKYMSPENLKLSFNRISKSLTLKVSRNSS